MNAPYYWDNGKTKTGHDRAWAPWHIVALDNSAKVTAPVDESCERVAASVTIAILRVMHYGVNP